jgi:hypothetical protein
MVMIALLQKCPPLGLLAGVSGTWAEVAEGYAWQRSFGSIFFNIFNA